jgi:hypothetical protein
VRLIRAMFLMVSDRGADMAVQEVLFDERCLLRHAGAIMTEPDVALVELVANAWDAYAIS